MLENRDTNVKQLISMEKQRSQIVVLVWQGYLFKKESDKFMYSHCRFSTVILSK